MEPKPRAILDFYGCLNFSDSFWHSPLPMFANLPDVAPEFLAQVFDEEIPTWTPSSMQRPPPGTTGPPKPDLSRPRSAWLWTALKKGFHLENVVKDGDYARVDPVSLFSAEFPPTIFLHGNKDTMVDFKFSKFAYESLRDLGVETELLVVEGGNHIFDAPLKEGMPEWEKVEAGFEFLAKHVI